MENLVADEGLSATTPSLRRRLIAFAAAALAALIGFTLAPQPWPSGDATLEIVYRGSTHATLPVELGSTEPLTFRIDGDALRGTLELPDGAPTDAPIRATLQLDEEGGERPQLARLSARLILPDGRSEPIPIVRSDQEAGTVQLLRRPPDGSSAVLALLGAVVVLWVTEAVPLFVTSLAIPVVLVVAGVGGPDDALAPFFHPIIALFFAGFLMAEAMRRTGLDHLAAITLVARTGRSPLTLFAAMIVVSAFLSLWMSNTAAVAVLLPIALAVTEPLASVGYKRAVVLGIAYAATIGGVGSAIGTPANPLAIEFLRDFVGRDISFVEWFTVGMPMVVLFLPLMGAYLWWRMRARPEASRFVHAREIARRELQEAGRPSRDQLVVLAVFLGVVAFWLTETWHGLETGIVALGGAVTLALLNKVLPEDLGRISWASLLTFGGGLTLGFFLLSTGTSDWIATRLDGLSAIPAPIAITVVATVTLALTTVASNTATAAMLVPLAIPLAGITGVDPVLMVLVVAVASSVDFALVIGTPPTLLAYSTRLYTPGQIFRVGIVLDVVGILLLSGVVVWIWGWVGVT
ncbi:MAG TPA: DASS family sodium-coupled anion symporter [Candidatus Limnocylindria bacterium]